MAKDKEAELAILRARTQLLVEQPFFGALAMHMGVIEVNDPKVCNTMAVDGRNFYYHPPFVKSLTEAELKGVKAHEVLHVAWQHMTRRRSRHPVIWNEAGDFVINGDLLKSGFTLPAKRLHDPKFDGMSTEEVYDRLWQEAKKSGRLIQLIVQGSGNAEGTDAKGGGAGGIQDTGGCGAVWDAAPPGKEAQGEALGRDMEVAVRMAVNVAKRRQAGKLPGYLERLINELDEPKVNWREHTRQFVDGNMTKDFSWTHVNRRTFAQGIITPGYVPDAMHHLLCFIDISGSISHELMKAMVSEAAGALDEGIADKLTIVYFDDGVRHVDEFISGDLVTAKSMGGGGTDFEPCFKWTIKNAQDATCILFLTDMYPSHWNLTDPGVPVLWGAYTTDAHLKSIQVPFGNVVHIEGVD